MQTKGKTLADIIMDEPILLSEKTTWAYKYLPPIVVILSFSMLNFRHDGDYIWSIWLLVACIIWYLKILPLKKILFTDNNLIISSGNKMDTVQSSDLEELKIGIWPLFITRLRFKIETKFGKEVYFIIRRALWYRMGDSKEVVNILKQLQSGIEKQT